jgi:hypothetical protein
MSRFPCGFAQQNQGGDYSNGEAQAPKYGNLALLNVGKQLTDGLDIEFGPYYHHGATRNAELILDGNKFKMGGIKFNEYGFRVATKF